MRTELSGRITFEWIRVRNNYPLFHFVFHDTVDKIVDQIKNGWRVDVVHTFGTDRIGILHIS